MRLAVFPQVLHEPLIDEDPVFITTCTERELRKRKKRKFSLWVRQCSSTGFICQVSAQRWRISPKHVSTAPINILLLCCHKQSNFAQFSDI